MEILLIVLGLLALILYGWYAAIVSRRNKALEALSGIDVQLQKRAELIPNILKIAARFMEHEKGLLTEITELRSRVASGYDPKDRAALQQHLASAGALQEHMGQLFVQVENYPELKSDQTMVTAMQSYNETEAQIAAARRFYNAAVAGLNNAVQIFPGSALASMAGITAMPFYEAPEGTAKPVDASDYLR